MEVTNNFDGGSIEVVDTTNYNDIQLKLRDDNAADFRQWFYCRISGVRAQKLTFRIINAGESSYSKAWEDYRPVISYDRETWLRVDAEFDGQALQFSVTPEQEVFYLAYFTPYSYERYLDCVAAALQSPLCALQQVCKTVDGRDLDILRVGTPGDNKKILCFIARQHPGETMAAWFMEGFLSRLLDEANPVARRVLEQAVYYVVPCMNPDGGVRGNLRTNAAGVDLNRAWQSPNPDKSPEVFYVRQLMQETGVDMFLDIHGDEELPYNFVAGCEGIPSYDKDHAALEAQFKIALMEATPDFQDEVGYDKDEPGQALLTLAATYVGEKHRCLSYTIEMPFKDNANLPDDMYGWSSERAMQFGHDTLSAVLQVLPNL